MEKQVINPANLMSVQEYAAFIGVKRQTVYNWIKEGNLKQVHFLGKSFDPAFHLTVCKKFIA